MTDDWKAGAVRKDLRFRGIGPTDDGRCGSFQRSLGFHPNHHAQVRSLPALAERQGGPTIRQVPNPPSRRSSLARY